jgi:hypothetical protein
MSLQAFYTVWQLFFILKTNFTDGPKQSCERRHQLNRVAEHCHLLAIVRHHLLMLVCRQCHEGKRLSVKEHLQ